MAPIALGGTMIFGSLIAVSHVSAQASDTIGGDPVTASELLPTEFGDEVGLGQGDIRTTIARVIRIILGFLGVIAVCFMLYGGFMWMTAGGSDRVGEAQKIIVAAAIGLAIILSAYAVTSFVISNLVTVTTA